MSKYDLRFKLWRLLQFLVAVNDPHIFACLALRGFTNEDRREGWELFHAAGGYLVDMKMPATGGGLTLAALVRAREPREYSA